MKEEVPKDVSRSGWPLLVPNVTVHGPCATHNMPCVVYQDLPAVLDLSRGIYEPSWSAQADGWVLIRVRWPWLRRKLQEWFR